jgi:two-component system nitrogen regulation response regulator GlnG/two-component system response regulator HydG
MPDRPGLLGQADGGFLFLDEIGELPAELQAHLLRVLDAGGEYQRLGESVVRRSNFRLIAATNRDPSELKPDLLARLTVRVELPPLAERREDIPLLARHLVACAAETSPEVAGRFITRASGEQPNVRVDAKLVDDLLRREYHANVRELDAILWAAMAASRGDVIAWSEDAARPAGATIVRRDEAAGPSRIQRTRTLRNFEPSHEDILLALARENGNVARAAQTLGLSSRYALYRLLSKLGIDAGG